MTLSRHGQPDASSADTELAEAREPERPPRPLLVEIASAVLIVDGLLSTILSLDLAGRLADQNGGIEPLALFTIAFGLATTLLGVLLHFGRAWLVTLNVAAIAGFLELTAASPAGLVTGAIDVLVVLALLWTRPWFAWRPGAAAIQDEDDGQGGGDQAR